jgi:LysM repeat protein
MKTRRYGVWKLAVVVGLWGLTLGWSSPGNAFPHVVQPDETLAKIAERVYGLVEYEKILVTANGLDVGGGIGIVPGMRIEIPANEHIRVQAGDSWASLAEKYLGSKKRGDIFASANDVSAWIQPEEGAEIKVPYNLRVVVKPQDNLVLIARRFLKSKNQAWSLAMYNGIKGDKQLKKGSVFLVPLTKLTLTPQGKAEAARAWSAIQSEGGGSSREAQKRAEAQLPALLSDVRNGRYVDAISQGTQMLALGELSRPQIALIQRQLLEAFAALGAQGLAKAACKSWRQADPNAVLDPVYLSPKLLAACTPAYRMTPRRKLPSSW